MRGVEERPSVVLQHAHDDANTDYVIMWNALVRDLPLLAAQLGRA